MGVMVLEFCFCWVLQETTLWFPMLPRSQYQAELLEPLGSGLLVI